MDSQLQAPDEKPSVVRRAVAGLVLILALAIAVKLVIGLVTTFFTTALLIIAAIALLWALKTLLW